MGLKILLKIFFEKKLAKIKECTYLVVDDNVVFGRHVISNVVVNNKTQQPVE